MKKISLFLVCLLLFSFGVYAKTRDALGNYYSTDIVTTLNGAEIDSVNIGGQTLICAESMQYYSFFVQWDGAERTLEISSVSYAENGTPPKCVMKYGEVGEKLGNYYETDIKTYLDNELITSYNIGGITYILAEETANMGYSVNWNEENRTLDITSPDRAGHVYTISLSKSKSDTEEGNGSFSIDYTKNGVTGTDDADRFDCVISCSGKEYGISMGFYQNQCLFTSSLLLDKLNSFKYSDIYGEICKPEEKYDITDKSVKISINGYNAEKIAVSSSRGNGHVDYHFSFSGIPIFTKDEIESIHFCVDENPNSEKYEFLFEKDELDSGVVYEQ